MKKFGLAGQPRSRPARARHVIGKMNKLEEAYAHLLEARKREGTIRDYKFEALKLRLANLTYYSSDFLVVAADDVLELHEVKGFWEDDARVKVKVAAEQFPWFRFVGVTRRRTVWQTEAFGPEELVAPTEPVLALTLDA